MAFRSAWLEAVLVFVVVFSLSVVALGQDSIEEPPAEPEDVFSQLDGLENVSETDKTALAGLFNEAIEGGYITEEEALALLQAGDFESPESGATSAEAINFLLAGLVSGQIDFETALANLETALSSEDPLAALQDLVGESTSPEGIVNAIRRAMAAAGMDEGEADAVVEKANEIIADGVPPGIVVRVVKQRLKGNEQEDADLLQSLDALGEAIASGTPPGLAANQVKNADFEEENSEEDTDESENATASASSNQNGNGQNNGNSGNNGNHGNGNNGNGNGNNDNNGNNGENGNGKGKDKK